MVEDMDQESRLNPEDLIPHPCRNCGHALLMPDGATWCGVVMKPSTLVRGTDNCNKIPGRTTIKSLDELLKERRAAGGDKPTRRKPSTRRTK